MKHRIWEKEHIEFLETNCKGRSNKELTRLLNQELGTDFGWRQVANVKCQYGLRKGRTNELCR